MAVYDTQPTAIVSGITTDLPDEREGVTWGHHSWEVHFTYINPDAGEVEPPPPVIIETPTDELIRATAWRLAYPTGGIAFNPDAAFPKAARAARAGAPVTLEFNLSDTRAQGFSGGIVAAPIGAWGDVRWIEW